MIDGGLRGIFHDRLRVGIHWQAIETGEVVMGVPDSNFCCDGVEGWVEYKQTDAWAVGIRPEQGAWLSTRHMRGGRTFVAVRRWHDGGPRKGAAVDELWLCSGQYARTLRHEGLQSNSVVWLGVWSGGPARWDWDAVRRHLTGSARAGVVG